jgi:hypothetical protein
MMIKPITIQSRFAQCFLSFDGHSIAYKEELQKRYQDDLEEQIEDEIGFGAMKRAKAVDSLTAVARI